MLCVATSRACCWAIRPRSEVCNPRKLEIDIRSGLQVERSEGRARGRTPGAVGGRGVAGVELAAQLAHEVVEERELLAHERAVDRVLAGDLGQQSAQTRRALGGGGGLTGLEQLGECLEGDGVRRDAERGACGSEDRGAVGLERGAGATTARG